MKRIFFIVLLILAWISYSQAQDTFYHGKTIRIVVGWPAGGFYDLWARVLARHMGKYIPGNPEIIVQNMPGRGSVVAANYVYRDAKPDGLTLGMPSATLYMDQLVGRAEVRFDVRKFNWIGTQDKRQMVLYMRSDSPYKSLGDIINAKEPPKCGDTGTSTASYLLLRMLHEILGANIQSATGYAGGSDVDQAVERGEVICRGMAIDPYFGREPFIGWSKKSFVRLLIQTGRKRDARAPEVPTIYELMDQHKTPEISRRVVQVILAGAEFGSPIFAPPGIPADRVKLLREAHARAVKDAELVAEAKKGKMDMDPSTGEELQALTIEVMSQPPEVIERAKKIAGL